MKSYDEKRATAGRASSSTSVDQESAVEHGAATRPIPRGLAYEDRRTRPGGGSGLPVDLQAGVEHLSGMAMDDVSVHYDSTLPAQVDALAYTQGRQIHVAPGQEEHLPHEAWHVVQQAQGRVRPTMQLKGHRAVNDDSGLEREADVMGARAVRWRSGGGSAPTPRQRQVSPVVGAAPIQMVKIKVVVTTGEGGAITLSAHPHDYELRDGEVEATSDQILAYDGADEQILASKRRKERRAERRTTETPKRMPKANRFKQIKFPAVVTDGGGAATLVYRGMSVNNIKNLRQRDIPVFTAQNPVGVASAIDHIVDDSPESPYLSFERGGLGISAGKYAPKPVEADNSPIGVNQDADSGFLKQEKSYTKQSKRDHAGKKRIGYVGGIQSSPDHLDVSTKNKANAKFTAQPDEDAPTKEKREKAITLATADKEVLVTPGPDGVGGGGLPFVAKVKLVDETYFKKNLIHQTSTTALGFYKGSKTAPDFCKIQVLEGTYRFKIDPAVLHNDEDSEDEMSDIEDMNLNRWG